MLKIGFQKVACTEPECNFVAEINEKIGTTTDYFRYCPSCGSEGSLNVWSVVYINDTERQMIDGEVY